MLANKCTIIPTHLGINEGEDSGDNGSSFSTATMLKDTNVSVPPSAPSADKLMFLDDDVENLILVDIDGSICVNIHNVAGRGGPAIFSRIIMYFTKIKLSLIPPSWDTIPKTKKFLGPLGYNTFLVSDWSSPLRNSSLK